MVAIPTKIDLVFSLPFPSEPGYYAVWRMGMRQDLFFVNLYKSFVTGVWMIRPTGHPETTLDEWVKDTTFVQWSQRLEFSFLTRHSI